MYARLFFEIFQTERPKISPDEILTYDKTLEKEDEGYIFAPICSPYECPDPTTVSYIKDKMAGVLCEASVWGIDEMMLQDYIINKRGILDCSEVDIAEILITVDSMGFCGDIVDSKKNCHHFFYSLSHEKMFSFLIRKRTKCLAIKKKKTFYSSEIDYTKNKELALIKRINEYLGPAIFTKREVNSSPKFKARFPIVENDFGVDNMWYMVNIHEAITCDKKNQK